MATPKWQPGKLYAPGSLVVPRTAPPPVPSTLSNAGFETGDDTGWTFDPGYAIANGNPDTGVYCCDQDGGDGTVADIAIIHDAYPILNPAKPITATCRYAQGAAPAGFNIGRVLLRWYDEDMVQIGTDSLGSQVSSGSNGEYRTSTVTATPPAGAVFAAIGGTVHRTAHRSSSFDNFAWNIDTAGVEGLLYRAVQPETGYSDNVEPTWPLVNGEQVIDNEVIWEAVVASRVTWQARPILKSGSSEPGWSTEIGGAVPDNTIAWITTSRRIDDPNCPNSEVVVLDENKVYAGDGDLIPFCAVNNPLDWTTPDNAGYLAFGNGKYGGNPVSALGLYRARLMAFNSEGMQDWQIDPDPALNHRLNSLPVGSTYHQSYAPFSNDAMLLTAVGFRTLGLAASTSNLSTGDAGTPIDPLILPLVRAGLKPKGLYVPSDGQYWAMFVGTDPNPYTPMGDSGRWTPSEDGPADYFDFPEIPYDNITLAYVYSVSETGKIGAWSRYYFPFPVESAVVAGTRLMVRAGDDIIAIDEEFLNDLMFPGEGGVATGGEDIEALLQWAWLEMGGQIGQDKTVEAVDLIGEEGAAPTEIAMGWDQRNPAEFTEPYALPYDTVPDEPVAFELTGPTISVRLYYHGGAWKFTALNVYLQDWRLAR